MKLVTILEAEAKKKRYTFTISPPNQPAFKRESDDRTFEEAELTMKMLQDSFPGAKIEIDRPY